jgi:hypothetical protein
LLGVAKPEPRNGPTQQRKKIDTRARKFGSDASVELDANPAEKLRRLECVEHFRARFNDAGGHIACGEGLDRAVALLEASGPLR